MKIDKAKEAEEKAQRLLEERNEGFRVMYDTVLQLEGVPNEDIFPILCMNLRRVCNSKFTALCSYNPKTRALTLKAVNAHGKGNVLKPKYCKEIAPKIEHMLKRKAIWELKETQGPVLDFFRKIVPKRFMKKDSKAYLFSSQKEKDLLALGFTVFDKGNTLRMKDMVQIYLNLMAMIVQRLAYAKALKENQIFTQNIFDSVQEGISILDKDLNILKVNKWMKERYPRLVLGSKCYKVYQNRKSLCPWCPSVKAMKTQKKQTALVPYLVKGRKAGAIELTSHPLKDSKGGVKGVIEYVREICDLKKKMDLLNKKV